MSYARRATAFDQEFQPDLLSAVAFEDRLEPISADFRVTGGRLRYAMAGKGPTIILFHGIPLSMSTWQDLFFTLATRYRVLAVDLPGFGRSSKDYGDYGLESMVLPVVELCRGLEITRTHAVGSSFGAAVAVTLALAAPGLVDRLVLINSVGIVGGTHTVERLARVALIRNTVQNALVRKRFGRVIFRAKLCGSYASLIPDEALVDHYYTLLLRQGGAESFLHTLRRFSERDLQRRLPTLKRPVLSIWGTDDRVLPAVRSLALQRLVPDCWATVIPGAGHLPHEERPARCAGLIDRFLHLPDA